MLGTTPEAGEGGKNAKDRKYGSAVPTRKGLLVPEYPPVALALRSKNGHRAEKKKSGKAQVRNNLKTQPLDSSGPTQGLAHLNGTWTCLGIFLASGRSKAKRKGGCRCGWKQTWKIMVWS